jgi:O-acetyl-ADP-ribose deacetylase (regulator of RNase III)
MGTISVEVGDITTYRVDAIVNAANARLLPGGGVCGAIHAAGGPAVAADCRRVIEQDYPRGVPVGGAVATTAGNLPARYVIHAVGPVFGADPDPDERLADAYRSSLALARELGLQSIAFPAISTGIYGFPAQRAAPIVQRTLEQHGADLDVILVFFDTRGRDTFEAHRGG